jgi:tRNA dimethylallyltransferase
MTMSEKGKNRPCLVIIVGPTGVGKTGLALEIAGDSQGEIISADSMQVYRYMDIGTAKPTEEERGRVEHHLIDVVDPDEEFNAALFVTESAKIIETLHHERKRIFVVGGTGLYVRALVGGLFMGPGADHDLRDHYHDMCDRYGKDYLHRLLESRDPRATERIHGNDTVRTIRALEVLELTGKSIVTMQEEHGFKDNVYDYRIIGLERKREDLYERIDIRVDHMMAQGLVDEVKELIQMGYGESLRSMQSMCYRHIVDYIKGDCDRDESVRLIKRDTRHYAKRQLTWFKRDEDVTWFDPDNSSAVRKEVENFFEEHEI